MRLKKIDIELYTALNSFYILGKYASKAVILKFENFALLLIFFFSDIKIVCWFECSLQPI